MSDTKLETGDDSQGVVKIELTQGKWATVSNEDQHQNEFTWCYSGRVAMRTVNGKVVHLHRVIAERMGLDLSKQIKFRDDDKLNCVRDNLYQSHKSARRPSKRTTRKTFDDKK